MRKRLAEGTGNSGNIPGATARRVCKGSRASKKSKTTALNLIYRMMQYPLANTLVVRKTANTISDSCYSDLKWACNRLKVSHLWDFKLSPLKATYKPTGQQIFFPRSMSLRSLIMMRQWWGFARCCGVFSRNLS